MINNHSCLLWRNLLQLFVSIHSIKMNPPFNKTTFSVTISQMSVRIVPLFAQKFAAINFSPFHRNIIRSTRMASVVYSQRRVTISGPLMAAAIDGRNPAIQLGSVPLDNLSLFCHSLMQHDFLRFFGFSEISSLR